MASFLGRSGHHILFAEDERAVVVDTRINVVVASGATLTLEKQSDWTTGEFSELDERAAEAAFASMKAPLPVPTGRLYTIPLGVQRKAKSALEVGTPGTAAGLRTATLLASGGQIDFGRLTSIADYFRRHDTLPESAGLWGGEAGQRWATSIVERESVVASANINNEAAVLDVLALDPEATPEFIARVHKDGSGIDRLYRVDIDGSSYVWDDGTWTTLGLADADIWSFDYELDGGSSPDATHILIDPESAIKTASLFTDDPSQSVFVEDLDTDEYYLALNAIPELDWEVIDSAITEAGLDGDEGIFRGMTAAVGTSTPPDDGMYGDNPDARSDNAKAQLRDKTGKFAQMGSRVMVGGDPNVVGKITRIHPENGTLEVFTDDGRTLNVYANSVESVGDFTQTIPGKPVDVPRVDFSGIMGEPRTPINRTVAQIPGTLPQMKTDDLHKLLYNFPAWVKAQREAYKSQGGPAAVGVQAKDSLSRGAEGRALEETTGQRLRTNAYSHPLLKSWLNKKNTASYYENRLWYKPITAAGEEAEEVTPDTSDVQPVYLAEVSPDDPRAVFKLMSLVPASSKSPRPCVYTRKDGEWTLDAQALNDLNSPTPPPVVPLDDENLQSVLTQVDDNQDKQDSTVDEADVEEVPVPTAEPTTVPQEDPAAATPAPVEASAFDLMVLWGPRKDFMAAAVTAAGGADRNKGGAEKLRRYWTKGPGAAKIRWGTPGDWTRCVRQLSKHLGPRAKGYCALRHREMTGMWTGDKKHRQKFSTTAVSTTYSTAMVASSDTMLRQGVLRVRSAFAKQRLEGLVASAADPKYKVYRDAQQAITAGAVQYVEEGQPFLIPMLLPEGVESGDGRIFQPGKAELRDLPLPLMWQFQTADGHTGAVVVGRIDHIERVPGGMGNATGVFDTGVWGREAERMVGAGFLYKVSADMDNFEYQQEEEAAADDDSEGPQTVKNAKKLVTSFRIMGATIVAKPAFQECTIELIRPPASEEDDMFVPEDGLYIDEEPDPVSASAIVAAAYIAAAVPVTPPKAWFDNPRLNGPTPLTVDDSGHVYGHIASWDMDHIGMANTAPPRSRSNYAYFRTGVLRTEEGDDINVGQLTLAGGHAGLNASARDAVKHYDDTASAVADVAAGEDEWGIWVAGALRPGVTGEQVRTLRASAPSGDWRPIKGRLELVAVCQVNVPGFPVARARVASGQITALVAAGAATLAQMKADPVAELAERLSVLEQFSAAELSLRASAARERFAPILSARDAELNLRAETLFERMSEAGYVSKKAREEAAKKGQALPDGSFPIRNVSDLKNAIHAYGRADDKEKVKRHIMKRARALGHADLIPEEWTTASIVASLRERALARASELASDPTDYEEKKIKKLLKDKGEVVREDDDDPKVSDRSEPTADENVNKYKPGHQPRDYNGQFRDVLARLKENLGVSGNQGVIEKLQETDKLLNAGDYSKSVKAGLDLKNQLDRLDDGALNAEAIGSVREAARALGEVMANLPLPFENQAAKIRFSDLPPTLRDLVDDFIKRVENKIGGEDAEKATAALKSFKSGGDVFSQSEISEQMSKLLRLLT